MIVAKQDTEALFFTVTDRDIYHALTGQDLYAPPGKKPSGPN